MLILTFLSPSVLCAESDTCVYSPLCSLCVTYLRKYGSYFPGHTRYHHGLSSSCSSCRCEHKCTLCEVFQRYYGRPYWGHSGSYHPRGCCSHCSSSKVLDLCFWFFYSMWSSFVCAEYAACSLWPFSLCFVNCLGRKLTYIFRS